MLCQFSPLFVTGDCHFLTFRGLKPVHQKIDFVTKLCTKIASTYLIVREKNKKSAGYHFHAIVNVTTKPKKSWFKKGCHFHFQPIGRSGLIKGCVIPPNYTLTSKDVEDYVYHEPEKAPATLEDDLVNVLIKKTVKNGRKRDSVLRVLNYMCKDFEMPIQYHDYVCVIAGKNRVI